MRFKEILRESVTFGVARLEDHDGRKIYSDPFMKKTMETCFVCDGTGKETFGGYTDEDGKHVPKTEHECGMCKGVGKNEEWRSTAGELNVANSNAMAIQEMLGLDPDYSGAIKKEDFPAIRRRLIKIKNGGIESHTQEPSKSGGQMRAYTNDQGQSSIGRGATMHDMGRSYAQVERYIDSLLSLMDFAQKNDCDLVWG
jgi:hypothetical protein